MDFRFEQLCGSVKTYLAGLNQRELMARPREEKEEQKTLDLEIFSFSSEKKERDARE